MVGPLLFHGWGFLLLLGRKNPCHRQKKQVKRTFPTFLPSLFHLSSSIPNRFPFPTSKESKRSEAKRDDNLSLLLNASKPLFLPIQVFLYNPRSWNERTQGEREKKKRV